MFCLLFSFQERRKAIEAERQAKLLELDYKRREQVFRMFYLLCVIHST